MSKDIRSYFTIVSKKTTSETNPKKRTISALNISDDIVPSTPEIAKKSKKNSNVKRRRIVTVSSDSETENENKKASKQLKTIEKPTPRVEIDKKIKKKVNPFEVFGDQPIKQEKVCKKSEINIHDDEDFDKTLLDLDEEELLQNIKRKPETSSVSSEDADQNKKTTNKKNDGNNLEDFASSSKTIPGKKINETKVTPSKKTNEDFAEKKEKTPARKRKSNDEENDETIDQDQDRYEKKRYSAMLYQKYLNRSGPAHLGAKWIPKGKPECLKGLCFIITGVLDSLEREDAQNLITQHGGRFTQSVSGKVNYVVLGDDAGPAKVEKARKLGIKMISEDDLIDLICLKSGITNENTVQKPDSNTKSTAKSNESEDSEIPSTTVKEKQKKISSTTKNTAKKSDLPTKTTVNIVKKKEFDTPKQLNNDNLENLTFVDKYKPKDISQIIGQQGEKSNLKKLLKWLEDWSENRVKETVGKGIPKPSPWAKDDSGAYFRAALLSGSPGVGKTTTAHLACQHLNFDIVAFNASDTRNKRTIQSEVARVVSSTSLAAFANSGAAPSSRRVLIMDEVDGMSGNEDRGGVQELIALIKGANIPVICLCNDRQHPKIRTLANYCFDLRFTKPKLEQIRGAMMSICFKENISLKPDILGQIINSTGLDVRQTLNHLSMLTTTSKIPENSTKNSSEPSNIQKDVKLGPWEVVKKVFSVENNKISPIYERSKLFFHDYSLGPLFIQENYLKLVPNAPKKTHLQKFAQAADFISLSDVVDAKIRSTQNWGLLELQAMYVSVIPGYLLQGQFSGQIDFPGWLGRNSKKGKFERLCGELCSHTRISTSGDRTTMNLDYARALRDAVTTPLLRDSTAGISTAIDVMRHYNLVREDVTSLVELSHWPKQKDPFEKIDSKVKAAFTRAYNKESPALPYAASGAADVKSKRRNVTGDLGDIYGEDVENAEDSDDAIDNDDINTDAMIKAKKPSTAKNTSAKKSSTKNKSGTSKPRAGKKSK